MARNKILPFTLFECFILSASFLYFFFHNIEDHMGNKCFAEIFAKLISFSDRVLCTLGGICPSPPITFSSVFSPSTWPSDGSVKWKQEYDRIWRQGSVRESFLYRSTLQYSLVSWNGEIACRSMWQVGLLTRKLIPNQLRHCFCSLSTGKW